MTKWSEYPAKMLAEIEEAEKIDAAIAQLAPEIEPLVLAQLEKEVKARRALTRVPLEALYADGERKTIRSPLDDAKLGIVLRTSPEPTWQIVDREALTKWLEADPDNVEQVDDIAGSEEQVIEVLREHAPELLARVERVRPSVIAAALEVAKRGTPIPGIEKVKPRGTLSIRPDKAAGEVIARLVEAKVISWDGKPLALPARAPAHPPTALFRGDPDCPSCGLPAEEDDPDSMQVADQWWHESCFDAAVDGEKARISVEGDL